MCLITHRIKFYFRHLAAYPLLSELVFLLFLVLPHSEICLKVTERETELPANTEVLKMNVEAPESLDTDSALSELQH